MSGRGGSGGAGGGGDEPVRVRPAEPPSGAHAAPAAAPAPRHRSILEGPNPFDPTPVRDPWQPPPPRSTVSGPFDAAGQAIERTLAAIAADPSRRTRSLLVLGEPGAGKTHGVQALLAGGLAARAHVAWFDRYGAPAERMRGLAARLLRDLGRRDPTAPPESSTQLEVLLAGALEPGALPPASADGIPDPALVRAAAARVCERDPALDRRLVQLLLRAAVLGSGGSRSGGLAGGGMGSGTGSASAGGSTSGAFGGRRGLDELCDWIRGATPTPQLGAALGLRGLADGDETAFEVIATLARLGLRTRPLLLVLDHIEALGAESATADAEVRSLVAALCRLHDCVPNLALVLVARTAAWHKAFERRLNASERARVLGDRVDLAGIDAAGAEALVVSRLRTHLGEPPRPYPTFPFPTALLDAAVPLPPGDLLDLCAREVAAMRQRGRVDEVARFSAQAVPRPSPDSSAGWARPTGASSGAFARPGALGGAGSSGAAGGGVDEEARAARAGLGGALLDDALARMPADAALPEERLAQVLERCVRAVAGRRLLDDPAVQGSGRFAGAASTPERGGDSARDGAPGADGAVHVLALPDQPGKGGREARLGFAVASPGEAKRFRSTLDDLERALPGLTRLVLLRHDPDAAGWRQGRRAYERLVDRGLRERPLDGTSCRALVAIDALLSRADRGRLEVGGAPIDPGALLRLLAREGVLEARVPVVKALLADDRAGGS